MNLKEKKNSQKMMKNTLKTAAIALAVLVRTTYAGTKSLQALLDNTNAVRLSNTTFLADNQIHAVRNLQYVSLQMQRLQEYGCWCYFDEFHGLGHGPVQNGYDSACQKLHQGIECANKEIPNCDANVQDYEATISSSPAGDGNVVYDCVSNNGGDECAMATCWLESNFIAGIMEQSMVHEKTPEYDMYSVSEGAFTRDQCTGPLGPRPHENICCGTFLANTRRPIPVYEGTSRECCEREDGSFKTFDPMMFQCCAGTIGAVGAC